jgi:hypothetical protein
MRTAALALGLATLVLAAPSRGAVLVRLDGIGPLRLGMARMSALDTGWLAGRSTGCRLGGRPYPVDYAVEGPAAPPGFSGTAEFTGGKLVSFSFAGGVRTATGVVPGKTTWAGMVSRYRSAGFRVAARYDATFPATFVTVRRRRGGPSVIGGLARGKVVQTLGLPHVRVCE